MWNIAKASIVKQYFSSILIWICFTYRHSHFCWPQRLSRYKIYNSYDYWVALLSFRLHSILLYFCTLLSSSDSLGQWLFSYTELLSCRLLFDEIEQCCIALSTWRYIREVLSFYGSVSFVYILDVFHGTYFINLNPSWISGSFKDAELVFATDLEMPFWFTSVPSIWLLLSCPIFRALLGSIKFYQQIL